MSKVKNGLMAWLCAMIIILCLGEASALQASYTYAPFGELIESSGSYAESNPWRYATKYYDAELGLYYYGHRYYHPATGQWLSREPLGEDESVNLYSYCHNDPVNKVDVLGLAEKIVTNQWLKDSHYIQAKHQRGEASFAEVTGSIGKGIGGSICGLFQLPSVIAHNVNEARQGQREKLRALDKQGEADPIQVILDRVVGDTWTYVLTAPAHLWSMVEHPQQTYEGVKSIPGGIKDNFVRYTNDPTLANGLDIVEDATLVFGITKATQSVSSRISKAGYLNISNYSLKYPLNDPNIQVFYSGLPPFKVATNTRALNPATRLPRTNGQWSGTTGNGLWKSDLADVNIITGGKPIQFANGRPIFTPWSKGSIKFKPGQLNGSKADFDAVYDYIRIQKGLNSKNAAKTLLRQQGLTPHHLNNTTIQLIPSKLHGNIPHIGSASDLRGEF